MSNEPPHETSSSEPSFALDELLLQLERLKRSNTIPAYISLLQQRLQFLSLKGDPPAWAALQFALGNALQQNLEGDRELQLMQAIASYNAALTVYTREHTPVNWVAVQQYKRSALCDLVELQEGVERLETLKAIAACCDGILMVCTREATPANWVVAVYHKAAALYEIAETLHGEECFQTLQESISCYDAALNVYNQNTPLEWATTQNSKGMSLYKLAQLCEGKKRLAFLQEALACYNHALKIYDREDNKVYRSPVLLYKGMALQDLAEMSEGLSKGETLLAALAYYEEAIRIYSQENDPLGWASGQSYKGNVLNELSHLWKDARKIEALHAALDAYNAALTVYTWEETPADRAKVLNNKGNALYSLAELLKGQERAGALQAALACCNDALMVFTHEAAPAHWATTQNTRGNILRAISELQGGTERAETLRLSIACFDAALLEYPRDVAPAQWAKTRHNKGLSLYLLAQLLSGMERIEILWSAIACYDDALAVYTFEIAPAYWAMMQNNKSIVLHTLAELLGGEERREALLTAIACCEEALRVYTFEEAPSSWAMIQSNKGDGLRLLARWLSSLERKELLNVAIACYDAALTVYTREGAPGDWARTQNNKGVALRDLSRLLTGTGRLEKLREAIDCYDKALLERRREVMPLDWAATQSSKGNVLSDLAELLKGEERLKTLEAAIDCFDAALLERQREVSPGNWAKTQNSKGVTLRHLARLLTEALQREMLQGAIACFDAALLEYHREDAPVDWAMVQSNEGVVLSDLAELLESAEKTEMLERAVACFDAALLEYRREVAPIDWALAQSNKGNVLCDLAQLLDGIERAQALQSAIACIDASLTVYTREVLPAEHRRITQSIGMLLFKEGNWNNAGRYLIMALDALDDLFALEVTAHGRQATLITSGDLTAYLAYALVRAGDASGARQAADALERGRARATGEAMARQEAQLAAAGRLAPELLERFREASNRLAAITLRIGISTATRETISIAEDTAEVQAPLELAAMNALDEQLAGYKEAREARAVYDEVVALIRQSLPDFLRQNGALEAAAEKLRADERLTYVAATPVGAVALLISGTAATQDEPIVEGWWDEQLTSTQLTHLLVGSLREDGKRSGGLLAAQADAGRLRQALRSTMQMLGASDGILTRLAACCRTAHLRRLVFVPCGLLGLLPLHAALVPLPSKEEAREPLLDVVQMYYTPSARIWTASRKRTITTLPGEIEALVVADPQPQADDVLPLAGAREEAEALSTLISEASGRVSVLTGEAATRTDILSMLQRPGATLTHAHFACHGLAELADPQTSGVLLAYGARLMTRDLLDPAIVRFAPLRLAVLSACRTALVGTELPDEAVGLPSAWLQAGAKGVLASLWPISDSRTVALMTKFYELHLLDGCEPIDALWLAQRWLRGLPTWREDCRTAGALCSAEGPEANKIVSRLGGIREERRYRDDREGSGEDILMEECGVAEGGITAVAQGKAASRDSIVTDQHWFWENARHWAAFVMYGT